MWTWIRRIWTAPVFESEAKTRTARLLYTTLWLVLIASIMMFVAALLLTGIPTTLNIASSTSSAIVIILASSGFLILAHSGRIRLTSVLLLLMLWSLVTLWIVGRLGITRGNPLLTLAFIIVLASLLLGKHGATVFTLLSGLTVLVGYIFQSTGYLSPPSPPGVSAMDLFLLVTQLGLIGLLLHYAMDIMARAMHQAQRSAQAQSEANRKLEALRVSLEQRVAERTRDLERRTTQLQIAADVGQVATSTLDSEQLMTEVTDLLCARFGFYHVGFFEADPTGHWAEYRAGAGTGAQALLQEGFRLEIGDDSLVGWCIAHAQSRVNQDVNAESRGYRSHPLVPDTRSEVALPLVARGQVLGALDVQSERPNAFDGETVASLQTIADQVAVALDNARLFSESQRALETTRRAYGELTRQAWGDLLRSRRDWGYRYTYRTVAPVEGDWPPEMVQALETGQSVQRETAGEAILVIPLRVRDQTVGVLSFYKPRSETAWTPDEISLLEQIIQQMGVALESAQFYEESQQRALQERIAREVSARMRETLDIDMVLRTSLQEIRQALSLASMSIRLVEPTAQGRGERV